MTEPKNKQTSEERIERLDSKNAYPIYLGALLIGLIGMQSIIITQIDERIGRLEDSISNLVQRVNDYHGTNWNYQSSSLKTNEVARGALSRGKR